MKTYLHFYHISLNSSENNRKKAIEIIKTPILRLITFFFFENRVVYNVEKYWNTGQATDDNMAHAQNMQGYKHSEYALLIAFTLQQWL